MTLTFPDARACVLREVAARRTVPDQEELALEQAGGRVLAAPALADRDIPALDRSVRDGFAVRAADLPGRLRLAGEIRAGEGFTGALKWGEAIEIMTGAPIPPGGNAVIMVEHVTRDSEFISYAEAVPPAQFISRQGEEAVAGQVLVPAGQPLRYPDLAVLAATGHATVAVFQRPHVAIIATGDELVDVSAAPLPHQVRNSNVYSLKRQVELAGGVAEILPIARDSKVHTRDQIERGLEADLLLLSGGVSAGRYDVVEPVLHDLGAEFFFDRVKIQPGQPVVFGRARERFFFGLPGNPGSTMVTFELFARAAIELLGGQRESSLPLKLGLLTVPFTQTRGLTRFLPALVDGLGALTPVAWRGSGDMPSIRRANVFLMTDPEREQWRAGETMPVLAIE